MPMIDDRLPRRLAGMGTRYPQLGRVRWVESYHPPSWLPVTWVSLSVAVSVAMLVFSWVTSDWLAFVVMSVALLAVFCLWYPPFLTRLVVCDGGIIIGCPTPVAKTTAESPPWR